MLSFYEFDQMLREGKVQDFLKGAATVAIPGLAALGIANKFNSQPQSSPYNLTKPGQVMTTKTTQPPKALDMKALGNYISQSEGFKTKAYDDGRGNQTIGIGHMFKPTSNKIFQELFGPKYDLDQLKARTQEMDKDDVYKLFNHDASEHLTRAKMMFPKFGEFPPAVQMALIDSVYRGDTGKNTQNLINQGKWREAAKEYLNRYDYKNRAALVISGIGPRMERNQQAMLDYANQLDQ